MTTKGKNQWVVNHPDGWAVRGEGNQRVTRITQTQREAIEIAKDIARNQNSEVVIQDQHGQIRSKDSYGHDPNPPKDKEH